MSTEESPSKPLNIILWITQGVLSAGFLWAVAVKFFMPADQLAAMWPWAADNPGLVKITGVLDFLAGIGLILPGLLHAQPKLTIYAAYGTIALMVAASVFHISRGEGSLIGVNIFFAAAAVFVAWGRRHAK